MNILVYTEFDDRLLTYPLIRLLDQLSSKVLVVTPQEHKLQLWRTKESRGFTVANTHVLHPRLYKEEIAKFASSTKGSSVNVVYVNSIPKGVVFQKAIIFGSTKSPLIQGVFLDADIIIEEAYVFSAKKLKNRKTTAHTTTYKTSGEAWSNISKEGAIDNRIKSLTDLSQCYDLLQCMKVEDNFEFDKVDSTMISNLTEIFGDSFGLKEGKSAVKKLMSKPYAPLAVDIQTPPPIKSKDKSRTTNARRRRDN